MLNEMSDGEYSCWLGLGANMGDPETNLADALSRLDAIPEVTLLNVSPLYRTPPWGKTDQDWFYNCCAALKARATPEKLLQICLDIELEMKRVRLERWGPRNIDIDILVMEDMHGQPVQLDTPNLTLPHPRMTQRGFVLKPLSDIAPELNVEGHTVMHWLGKVDVTGIEAVKSREHWWR